MFYGEIDVNAIPKRQVTVERDRQCALNPRARVEKPWSKSLHEIKGVPSFASRDLLTASTFCQQTCEFSQYKVWRKQENLTCFVLFWEE